MYLSFSALAILSPQLNSLALATTVFPISYPEPSTLLRMRDIHTRLWKYPTTGSQKLKIFILRTLECFRHSLDVRGFNKSFELKDKQLEAL